MAEDKKIPVDPDELKQQKLLNRLDRLERLHNALESLANGETKLTDLEQIKLEISSLNSVGSEDEEVAGLHQEPGSEEVSPESPEVIEAVVEADSGTDEETARSSESEESAAAELETIIADIDRNAAGRLLPDHERERVRSRQASEERSKRHVLFTLAGTQYAVPAENVQEVGEVLKVTPVPNVPDWLAGVVNLRGDIISMVDLRLFLGLEPMVFQQQSRMLVTQAGPENMVIGLIVDQVSAIRVLQTDRIAPPAAPIEDQVSSYLQGVYEHEGQLLIVLDIEQLLLSSEMQQFQAA